MKYTNLWAGRLTSEQRARTCGYWYVVQSHFMAHTAFRSRAALDIWLAELGLKLQTTPPDSDHWWMPITGEYRKRYHVGSVAEFEAINGERVRTLSNGNYVHGIITQDEPSIRTLVVWHGGDALPPFDRAETERLLCDTWDHPDPHAAPTYADLVRCANA